MRKKSQKFLHDKVRAELGGTSFLTYNGYVVEGNYRIGDSVLLVYDEIDRRFLPVFKRAPAETPVKPIEMEPVGKPVIISDRGIKASWYEDDPQWIYFATVHGNFCIDLGQGNVSGLVEAWALSLIEQNGMMGAFLFCEAGPMFKVIKFKALGPKSPAEKHRRHAFDYAIYDRDLVVCAAIPAYIDPADYDIPNPSGVDLTGHDPEEGPIWQGDHYVKQGLYNCNPRSFLAYLTVSASTSIGYLEWVIGAEVIITYGAHYAMREATWLPWEIHEYTYELRFFMFWKSQNVEQRWYGQDRMVPIDLFNYQSVYFCDGGSAWQQSRSFYAFVRLVDRIFAIGNDNVARSESPWFFYEAFPVFADDHGESIAGFALTYSLYDSGEPDGTGCTDSILFTTWDSQRRQIIGHDKGQGQYGWQNYTYQPFRGLSRNGGGHTSRFMWKLCHTEMVMVEVGGGYYDFPYLIKNKSVYVIDGVLYRWDQTIPAVKMDPQVYPSGRVAKELLVAKRVLEETKVSRVDGELVIGVDSRGNYAVFSMSGQHVVETALGGSDSFGVKGYLETPPGSSQFFETRPLYPTYMWPGEELFDFGLLPVPKA